MADDTTRRRFVMIVEYDTIGDEEPVHVDDLAADALHGGLHNYYGVEVQAINDDDHRDHVLHILGGVLVDDQWSETIDWRFPKKAN